MMIITVVLIESDGRVNGTLVGGELPGSSTPLELKASNNIISILDRTFQQYRKPSEQEVRAE